MPSARLRLIINSPEGKIPLSAFSKAISKLQRILQEVDERVSKGEGHNVWAISNLSMASPAEVSIEPLETKERLDAGRSVGLVIDGLSSLNEAPKRPDGFSDVALKRVREFAAIKDTKTIDDIRLLNGEQEVSVTAHIIANVDELIGVPTKDTLGSIRGRLDIINVHMGLQVGIYQELDGKYIKAIIEEDDEKILVQVKDLLGRSIVAIGEIKRNKFGVPRQIRVKKIESTPKDTNIEDSFGIDPDFTDGLSVDEFLKRQRDE